MPLAARFLCILKTYRLVPLGAAGAPPDERLAAMDNVADRFDSAVERTYPKSSAGWVDGIYQHRDVQETPVSLGGADGLLMRGRRLVDESESWNDDPTSIGRDTYHEGTVARASLAARDWHLELDVVGADSDQVLRAVVNGEERAQFTLAAGERRTFAFDVALSQRMLELSFVPVGAFDDETTDWSELTLAGASWTPIEHAPAAGRRIFIASDSTVQTYFDEERPQSGWGEWLYWYLFAGHEVAVHEDRGSDTSQARIYEGEGPTIYNRALGARGTKSYIDEGRFDRLLRDLRPDDVLLIDLACNDTSKNRPMRYVSVEDHLVYLDRYVVSALDRGAVPVIVTSSPPYRDVADAAFVGAIEEYAEADRAYAREHGIALIDVLAQVRAYCDTLPPENLAALYLRADPRQYASHPDGVRDPVHLSMLGAFKVAGVVARGLAETFDWIELFDEEPGAPEPVRGLAAVVTTGIQGMETAVTWQAPERGEYYTVEKRNAATGRLYRRAVTIKPSYLDLPLFGQGRHISYTVTAWRDGVAATPQTVTVHIPVQDQICVDLG